MADHRYLTDEEMIKRMRKGEEREALTRCLMDRYKPLVRKKARTLFLIGGDTDDLIQEGMIGLFGALQDFDPAKGSSFAAFAGLCVERQLYRVIQKSNRKKHGPLNTAISISDENNMEILESIHQPGPEAILIDRESAKTRINLIRGKLSVFENQILDLYLAGQDYIEIGKGLGKSPKSIDNGLQRIRRKVKKILDSSL